MNKPAMPLLGFSLLAALALACAGGTSGVVVDSSERCTQSGGSGECEGTFGKLNGSYGKDIEDEDVFSGDRVEVEVQVEVERGVVVVSVQDPDGRVLSAQAEPGKLATLTGVAEGEFDGFEVKFEALGGEAEGVKYKITYRLP